MEDSWHSLVSQWEMDDFFNQSHMVHCNEDESLKDIIVFSPESNIPSSSSLQSNFNSKTSSFSAAHVFCFDNPNSEAHQNHPSKSTTQSQNAISRADRQHHILAERKRREELTNNIVELSAIIPGLKKMNDEYSMTIDDLIKAVGGCLLNLKSQKVLK
ncbi:transcription factor bHLH25-like [Vigna radiata var. radiata]|uniref:Transcription factor bHLH25-like n=1 Tax=Vigna radiata var. radiata TaxID=3916 RepID=A0A3Q0EZU9_VIGRR|nr:transcription factor bHLH25-like [Vigna radiata var. radiata]